ncbi:PREDICTED: dimethyladenosine transferase 1, mitochondrial-like [Amphimedon queenslandica]|uniref:rRNA adenine N(6)-methyltransferase n=1 Tax=Amphimedon queenslandica TaxID=400682 RepID=A0A1X7TQG9_AMPQE|nr:PREDICTED: dimethyladenosine transferase 1, mitochondrial-like [Amphimedon queenslandica]|eukprot:XP_019858415.1 PREDICTED: dimethyladenosine transferase 1, mitochondrial-like [Amphimedon queenslandica]
MVVVKRLPPLPTVSDIIRLYGLSAQQKLSQNFLLDLNLTNKIVRYADIAQSSCVCEVGSGPGAITRSILNATNAKVLAIEKDRRFLPSLELLSDATNGRLQVCHGDILDFDWPGSCDNIVTPKPWDSTGDLSIIGNLPFSVSIPLLLKWLRYLTIREGPFKYGRTTMTLTFQKEVAERITAPPGHTQRSRLSIMVQSLCTAKQCLTLHSSTFVPRPKVR